MATMSTMRRRMIEDMTIHNLSTATQRSYIHAISRFSDYCGLSPDKLTLDDARLLGASSRERRRLGFAQPGRLRATVLLRGEARPGDHSGAHPLRPRTTQAADGRQRRGGRAFSGGGFEPEGARGVDDGLSGGLRVSEVAALKVADIESAPMVLRIENGKGGKQRYVMLSRPLLGVPRSYWRLTRPSLYLFPGGAPDKPIEPTVLHAAGRSAAAVRNSTSASASKCRATASPPISWRAGRISALSRLSNRLQPRPRYRVQYRPPGGMRNGAV